MTTTTNRFGIDSMMYTPDAPWQGIGTEVASAATAEEAIVLAGLDWKVGMKDTFIMDKNGGYHRVPGWYACTRRDKGKVFGFFKSGYEPVQNRDKFGIVDTLVAAGEAVFHSAGSLKDGALTWMLMKLPGDLNVSNGSILERGILLTDSYDGSSALKMKFINMNKVCCNTLPGIVGGRGAQFSAKHTINLLGRVNEARQIMGLEQAYSEMLMRGIERIAQEAMNKAELANFLENLFGVEEDAEAISNRVQRQMDQVGDLFYNGLGNHGETRWDALNAVTEYVDHHRNVRVTDGGSKNNPLAVSSARLHAAWYGSGADMKAKAWELLVPAGVN